MAELDLLSEHGYVEETLGPLRIRTAAIEPPVHPLGPAYSEPHWGIWGAAHDAEPGWICLFNSTAPDADLEKLDEEALERAERLSIVAGASWPAVAHSAKWVRRVQEQALPHLPPDIYTAPPEQLRRLRAAINNADPFLVATTIGMTYFWANDDGGTYGPRFPA